MALPFSLNHMTLAKAHYKTVLSLASELGCVGVEFRNDLPDPLLGGDAPEAVRNTAREAGVRILGLSEVKMFNAWDDEIARQAEALLKIAKAIGAETVNLIPRCDGQGCGNGERQANLRLALREIVPMLEEFGIVGLVEPLGFERSSLRYKAEAMDAISAFAARGRLKLVHDTFHHYLAGETEFFAEDTGIVHISGFEVPDLLPYEIGDEHRVLVGPKDQLGNVDQLVDLLDDGYAGPVSYEAFSPAVHDLPNPKEKLLASMRHVEGEVLARRTALTG